MAIIRKNELKKMSKSEAQKKMVEIERAMLEAEGEGKHAMRSTFRKTIAQLYTIINSKEVVKVAPAKATAPAKAATPAAGINPQKK
ncbi:MAG: hypothetical protein V1492_01570 [Candidatus Micrarchaeota archaeon]